MEFPVKIELIIDLCLQAGGAILDIYNNPDCYDVKEKQDQSPLTHADLASHDIIEKGLAALTPDIPILSEESGSYAQYNVRKNWQQFWLVDPLDGTKEFIKRNGQFTVNIAFIQNNKPIAGVVYAPVLKTVYYGEQGKGAFKRVANNSPIELPMVDATGKVLKVVVSNSHLSDKAVQYIDQLKREKQQSIETVRMGSSLKLCLVAEGKADQYPRLGPTMEWDTAAAQAIVEAANKTVSVWGTDKPLQYNKEELVNPYFLVE